MSLVNQLEVTLKDFWPHDSDRMFVTDHNRGSTTTISRQLYAKLKAHAESSKLPFDAVVQQLRDEIHAEPIAGNNDSATANRKFIKGDRVKLSAKTIEELRRTPGWQPWQSPGCYMPKDRSGTVAHNSREENGLAVRWDGTKTPQYISTDLLEPSDD
jgi:hypothetical protein